MITTLRETKAKLSALVALAETGEEVIITVRGRPRARLSAIPSPQASSMSGWKKELKALHRKCSGRKTAGDSEAIINKLQEECCSWRGREGSLSVMEVLLQAGPHGRVPVTPEKRFLINSLNENMANNHQCHGCAGIGICGGFRPNH